MTAPRFGSAELASALGLHPPTPEQTAVIESGASPHLVVAGAGSGKTETMAGRVVWLVANGLVAADQVLGLTFTRKAAAELSDRIGLRLRALARRGIGPTQQAGARAEVSTYNAYAASLVADHGLRLGVEPGSRLLGEAASWQLAHDVVESWDADVRLPGSDLAALDLGVDWLVAAVLSLAGQCAEHLVDPDDLLGLLDDLDRSIRGLSKDGGRGGPAMPAKSGDVTKVLASVQQRRALVPVVQAYLRRKRELETLDFGDQVRMGAELAALPDVAAGERARFGVVLLDEYQDTSHAQLSLLRSLFADGHAVTAVGDPHQSIYGWRGASAANLDRFPSHFPLADGSPAPVLSLSTSWRNDRAALDAANTVSLPLRERAAVPVPALVPRPDAGDGVVEVGWHATQEDEAAAVAARIAQLWKGGTRPTVGVLCRQRRQFPLLENALRAEGLPVEVVGLGGLLDRPEVADVIATLRVLHDPARGDALVRLMTGPRWRIGPRDLVALGTWARSLAARHRGSGGAPSDTEVVPDPDVVDESSIVDALDTLPPTGWVPASGPGLSSAGRARLARLAAELADLRRGASLPLAELVGEIERTLMLEIELASAVDAADAALARAQLDAFTDVAAGFADTADRPSLGGFLSWLEAAAKRERGLEQEQEEEPVVAGDDLSASTTAVQLLTVHAAKGLEWDVVAVPGLVERKFPSGMQAQGYDSASGWPTTIGDIPYPLRGDRDALPSWRWQHAAHLKELELSLTAFKRDCGEHEVTEERRLAYVAFTRPRHTLLLSGFWWDDTKTPREVSRFLRDVVDTLADHPGVRLVGTTHAELASPPVGEPNPVRDRVVTSLWPYDPLGARRDRMEAAAAAVRAVGPVRRDDLVANLGGGSQGVDREILRLLAERDLAAGDGRRGVVVLPAHLSASRAVQLAADPDGLALALRRPMPSEPRPSTRRGTAFHAWMEQRLRSDALIDLDDLPGAGDDHAAADDELPRLQAAFEASEWASREVVAVEVDVETPVAGMVLRGRIDAVFAGTPHVGTHSAATGSGPRSPELPEQPELLGDGYDVVDWKTGVPPTGDRLRAAAVQLAVYRLAWSRLRKVPVEQVGAAFFYVSTGQTLRPAGDLDEQALVDLVTGVEVDTDDQAS